MVNDQLEAVSKGLGEMRGMAESVGDLRKVLSNVKTRGIVGEVQLGAILEEVLSPEQYDTNVATVPDSSNRVEFAVKIPGKDDEFVYLPIDAKFPGETYGRLEDAKDTGDVASVETAWKELETRLKSEAKDIHEKYVAPPATTSFAILFLPFEGLYAEVVNRTGLVEQLEKAQKQLNTASKTIDGLVGTRTRAMERTLKGVTAIGSLSEADELLGIDDDGDEVEEKDE